MLIVIAAAIKEKKIATQWGDFFTDFTCGCQGYVE